ncbi:MAG: RWP-RK domain-containing protein, partial [Promethearchaeia archaeon]
MPYAGAAGVDTNTRVCLGSRLEATSDKPDPGTLAQASARSPAVNAIWPRRKLGEIVRMKSQPVILDHTTISSFFCVPLHVAAGKLGISRTAMKTACRKLGIRKWPYREAKIRAAIERAPDRHCEAAPWPRSPSGQMQALPRWKCARLSNLASPWLLDAANDGVARSQRLSSGV